MSSAPLWDLGPDLALLFIVGGLSTLTMILVLVLVQNFLPRRLLDEPTRPKAAPVHLRPLYGTAAPVAVPNGGRANRRLTADALDRALDPVVEAGLGEPRILMLRPRFLRIRLFKCHGCSVPGARAGSDVGCEFERGWIESSVRSEYGPEAAVREVACRLRGEPDCEFEVRH